MTSFNRLFPPSSHSPWLVRQKIHENKALALERSSFQFSVNSTLGASRRVTFKLREKEAVAYKPGKTTYECEQHPRPTQQPRFFVGNVYKAPQASKEVGGGWGGGRKMLESKKLDSFFYQLWVGQLLRASSRPSEKWASHLHPAFLTEPLWDQEEMAFGEGSVSSPTPQDSWPCHSSLNMW